jgi:hypothetical protein
MRKGETGEVKYFTSPGVKRKRGGVVGDQGRVLEGDADLVVSQFPVAAEAKPADI